MKTNEIINRWMVRIHTSMPIPLLKYEITAPRDEQSQACFEYVNPSTVQKIYEIGSSNNSLLKITEPTLVLQGGEAKIVKMVVSPMGSEKFANSYIFVTDTQNGKTEAFLFTVTYSHHAKN